MGRFKGRIQWKSKLNSLKNLCKGQKGEKLLPPTPDKHILLPDADNSAVEENTETGSNSITDSTSTSIIEGRRIYYIMKENAQNCKG